MVKGTLTYEHIVSAYPTWRDLSHSVITIGWPLLGGKWEYIRTLGVRISYIGETAKSEINMQDNRVCKTIHVASFGEAITSQTVIQQGMRALLE